MNTKISVLGSKGSSLVINADALVIPYDSLSDLKTAQEGKNLSSISNDDLLSNLNILDSNFTVISSNKEYKESPCLVIDKHKSTNDLIFLSVQPSLQGGETRETLIDGLRLSYLNILSTAINNDCKNIVIPLLGIGNKAYDTTMIMLALISVITDFVKEVSSLEEICIVTRGTDEDYTVLRWMETSAKDFGLQVWYIRKSYNMQDYGLDVMTFRK
jgi:O-acetyl-ADP-ribose deacetylase (regulator of RNase III)